MYENNVSFGWLACNFVCRPSGVIAALTPSNTAAKVENHEIDQILLSTFSLEAVSVDRSVGQNDSLIRCPNTLLQP